MKKEFVLIICAFIIFSGCESLIFDRQPGDNLNSIPKEMQGKFIFYWAFSEDGVMQYEDTSIMVITEKSFQTDNDNTTNFLSDSARLSKYGDYYFWSTKAGKYWECSVIKMEGTGFIAVPLIVDFGENNDEETIRKFISNIENIHFNGEARLLVKTNENEMIGFFEEHLRHLFYLKFESYNE